MILDEVKCQVEDDACRAVGHYGIVIDKEELLKALKYDRNQYEKGYKDAIANIVQCKGCKHWERWSSTDGWCRKLARTDIREDFYCGYGERKRDG